MPQAFFVPESVIHQIKEAANIVSLVSEYVPLKRVGRNYQGLCPFHSEKTPSFMVNEEKQIFHCFGCGLGGNVFTFLMQYQKLSFPEAVTELAERLRITLPKPSQSKQMQAAERVKEDLREVLTQAALYFHQLLMEGKTGVKGRAYLRQRKMKRQIVEDFLLGYAPEGWENLTTFLKKKGISEAILEQTGLVIKKEKGHYYDRFRNRLIFPILDEQKRVIGFGGRSLGDESPKYLNSPETPLFSKGRVLYGYPQAASSIRQRNQALIVEGYFDLLSLHLHGFTQAVATLGTALSSFQIRRLKGWAEDLVLIFDGDPPGVQAALRSVPLFQQEGVSARIKVLPPDADPDSHLFQIGASRFSEELQAAEPMMTFFFNHQIQKGSYTIQDQVKVLERLMPYLKGLASEVERAHYVTHISQRLKVPESVIWKALRQPQKDPAKGMPALEKKLSEEQVKGLDWRVIEALLRIPQALLLLKQGKLEKIFESPETRLLYHHIQILAAEKGEVNPSLLVNVLDEQSIKNQVAALAIREFIHKSDEEAFLEDLLRKIRWKELQEEEQALSERIRSQEKTGITEELKTLLAQKQVLMDKRKELLLATKG
jgi:DNA primase